MIIFFPSRSRHTRLTCECSSDVCSSSLSPPPPATARGEHQRAVAGGGGDDLHDPVAGGADRKSVVKGKSEDVRVRRNTHKTEHFYRFESILAERHDATPRLPVDCSVLYV